MYSDQEPLLEAAINATNAWRVQAQNVPGGPVELNQVNFTFPEGQEMVFEWDNEAAKFKIRAL